MKLSIIVAIAENYAIGKDNELLWHLSADLKRFKQITTGHIIIMGRKTFDSIGKPLPNRHSIVISRNKAFKPEGVTVVQSIEEALKIAQKKQEVFVIGGGTIYEKTLAKANRIYLTTVHQDFEADTFFPKLNREEWEVLKKEEFPVDEKNKYPATFEILERKATKGATLSAKEMQHLCQNTLVSHLGIEFTEISKNSLSAKMPVDNRTNQPFGFLHGGASLALLETVGSGLSAAHTDTDKFYTFGMSVSANHIKPVSSGYVHALATFLHKGKRTQVINVKITDDKGDLICDGRITNMIVPKKAL